jgi:hypothetical protein
MCVLPVIVSPLFSQPAIAVDRVPIARAKQYIGQSSEVCGKVSEIFYGETLAWLLFGTPRHESDFSAILPEAAGFKFSQIAKDYLHKNVCVTGKIENYSGSPGISVAETDQIRIQQKQFPAPRVRSGKV